MQTFAELPISPPVLRAIQEMGFESPSPIQSQALPILLAGPTDFLGLAGTGTGKTAAFAIPVLEKIDPKVRAVQALILCPTRELAMQVAGQIDLLGKYKGIRTVTVYGGASYNDQIRGLRSGAAIVVGTPGRVIDHISRQTLALDQVKVLVLDEADEMFSMGFKDELDTILAGVPQDKSNTWLFSATMSREVRRIAEDNLRQPQTVQVNRTEMLSSGVEQYYYRSQEFEKPEMICALIEAADDFYGLIFCQTKALVADLTTFMINRGYKVDCLHGDKDQTSRERTMQAFRDRKLQVLICTDVAARGLDVKDVTHVVNYSLPREMESYVHRIGRTARSGKTGIVMNLVTLSHRHLISRIEAHTKVRMKEGFVPSPREIGAKKVAKLLATFEDQPFHTRVLEVMGDEWKTALAAMSQEQVAAHFITMMMPDVFGVPESRKTKKSSREKAPVSAGAVSAPISAPQPLVVPAAVTVKTAPTVAAITAPTDLFGDSLSTGEEERYSKPASKPASREPRVKINTRPASLSGPSVRIPRGDFAERPPRRSGPASRPETRPEARPEARDGFEDILAEASVFGVNSERPRPRTGSIRSASTYGRERSPSSRPERSSSRPERSFARGSDEGGSRPPRPRTSAAPRIERNPEAPMNLGKPPKHLPGPARTARHGQVGELNRRARRAAKFGNPIA